MRRLLAVALMGVALSAAGLGSGCSACAAELKEGEEAFRAGRYEEALAALKAQAARAPSDERIHRLLVLALLDLARYDEAIEVTGAFARANGASVALARLRGEALAARGRLEEAEAAFRQAVDRGAPDALRAQASLSLLRAENGRRDEARAGFEALIAAYNDGRARSADDLVAVGLACRARGAENPQLFKDALKAFDEAIAKDPGHDEAHVLLAELFLDKYNAPDAEEALKAVLERNPSHPRTLLAMARRHEFDGDDRALTLVEKSLAGAPSLGAARAFRGRLRLDLEDWPGAAEEAERALGVNPVDLEALSVLAASRFLAGDRAGFEDARGRAWARNPRHADLLNEVAEACVRNRLYKEAVDLAREAAALDPLSWRAFGILGLNELRVGEMESGRRNLETAFKGDPYNIWFKNTLDLLDTLPDYREVGSERLRFVVEKKEADLLAPYLVALGEEALDALAARYGYRPPRPLRIEVYRSHADFAVRTVGLADIGALGVCFGQVLAMDSPSAREAGSFNWGSTLWHELAHTITMGLTDHRVPRWLTEGISVHEEHRARPGWGDDVSLAFVAVHKQGKLLPIVELNNGFVRPRSPQQVPVSYYQASLVVDLIEREHGFPAVLALLRAYKEGLGTAEAFRKAVGVEPEALDRRLKAYVDERFKTALAGVKLPAGGVAAPVGRPSADEGEPAADDFTAQLRRGQRLFAEKKYDEAAPYLERAKALFPEYAEDDSPYWLLAVIHKENGAREKALAELRKLSDANESHHQANLDLAELLEEAGDGTGAAAALERTMFIHPYDASVHARLAALYAGLGEKGKAVREREALVALDPVDRPQALYELALARLEAGDPAGARREVLRALEAAPRFEKAQELLLRLSRERAGSGGTGGGR